MLVLKTQILKNKPATLKKQIELQEKIIKMLEKGQGVSLSNLFLK